MGKDKKAIISISCKKLIHGIIGTCLLCILVFHFSGQASETRQQSSTQATPLRGAIVDHLSISWPNPAFVKECTALLEGAGYGVDYYKGEEVTVEFYRSLPTHGYKLIVLRTHSAYIHEYLSLAMFTSEPYSKKRYIPEQLRNRVASGHIEPYHEGDPRYLVITDKFVRYSMKGSFNDAVIVMMGCTGIKRCMASAFLEKGAKVYIGWDGIVSAAHTDRATIQTLKHLLVEKQTIARAVAQTMRRVGQEPQFKSTLLFWPIKAGSFTVQIPDNDTIGGLPEQST